MDVNGRVAATRGGCMTCRCAIIFNRSTLRRLFSTRPTHRLPCNLFAGTRPFLPGGDGEHLHAPTKLARVSSRRGWIDLLLREPSHPPNPGRAGTRPFPKRAPPYNAPSMLRSSLLSMEVDGGRTRLAVGTGPCRCGRRRRWRDALFEGPFGRSPGRNKLRSQAAIGPCGFIHR